MRTTTLAICLLALLCSTAAAEGTSHRKLMQSYYGTSRRPNLGVNTLRAQAATSQAIENAVNTGASLGATRNAGVTGSITSWATNQDQGTFNLVDQVSGPYGIPFGRRHL